MKFHTDLEGSSFYSVFFWGGGVNYKKGGGLRFWVLGLRSSLYRHPLETVTFTGNYSALHMIFMLCIICTEPRLT